MSDRIKLSIVKFCYYLLNTMLLVLNWVMFRRLRGSPENILIYRIGNIGDIICSIPSMVVVRKKFPNAHITLLSSPVKRVSPGAKELLNGADFLDEMTVYYGDEIASIKGKINLIKRLRMKRFDLFIEIPNDLGKFRLFARDMLLAKMIGCKHAFGFEINTIRLFVKAQAEHLRFKGEVERLLDILSANNMTYEKIEFRLPIKQEDVDVVDKLFSKYSVDNGFMAMNPGAKRPSNRWPKERYAEVGKILSQKYPYKIFITGGPGDIEIAQWIASEIGDRAVVVAGKTSLLQSAELLRRCKFLITNDTGTMHLANAVGIPVVAIFSPWQLPGKWYPYGNANIVLRGTVDCELCYRFDCESEKCTAVISTRQVLEATEKILGTT